MSENKNTGIEAGKNIVIRGARVHNLKNINVEIPRNKFVVITGISGSGKSSLAFDTLYAEGQRRYVESLSSYARQFIGRMNKPEVDFINGIPPAIAIEQKKYSGNPRSTVGTSTEIYEYLKLLFTRIGRTYSPVSGIEVKKHSVEDVIKFIKNQDNESKIMIIAPIKPKKGRTLHEQLLILLQQGFSRIFTHNEILDIQEYIENKSEIKCKNSCYLIIDRFIYRKEREKELFSQIADSIETAFYEGIGTCVLHISAEDKKTDKLVNFSYLYEIDGILFEEPSLNLFSFNNPYGACKVCEGFGNVIGIDEDLVIPDKSLSVFQDAVVCWKGEKMSEWKEQFVLNALKYNFPIHRSISELTETEIKLLWEGDKNIEGINGFFKYVEEQSYKIQYRVLLSRYRGKTICPDCKGTRLRKEAAYVKINNKSINELVLLPIEELNIFFKSLKLTVYEETIAKRLLLEITNRIGFLLDVGLGYLTLNRLSNTLSGGESQRIRLATYLGSSLVGSMYILDEPSIGLHPRDTSRLIHVIKSLRNAGNSVIVVEHDEEIIRSSDFIIDIGPGAGIHGGEILFSGVQNAIKDEEKSITAKYLTNEFSIPMPEFRRRWKEFIEIIGARENNLKNINVKIPLNIFTVVTGVSGSGKTSLVKTILYPALKKIYGGFAEKSGRFDKISGDIHSISEVEFVDQNPIGRSSRSNPVTYVKAFDEIRELFAQQPLAKLRGYKPGIFSFNVAGGRCEECEGAGEVTIEMQFMADIHLVCDHCKGNRYKTEVLDIKYNNKNIVDILNLSVEEAIDFFNIQSKSKSGIENKIIAKLKPLYDIGLGYIKLGQSSNTLSGGEAQRVKLASFLSKGDKEKPTLFIFDEPSTGLHFHDIQNLLKAFSALIKNKHTVLVIEHNPDIIKSADWVIDLGPDGGNKGGSIVYQGIPEEIVNNSHSYTGDFLKKRRYFF